MKLYSKLIINLLDSVFPPRCSSCGKYVHALHTLCLTCWSSLEFITDPSCRVCGYPLEQDTGYCSHACRDKRLFVAKIKSAVIYNDFSAKIIHPFKYQDKTENSVILSNWIYSVGRDMVADVDMIVPVPLHKIKLFERKYNQSAILAKSFAKKVNKRCEFNILIRQKYIPSQSKLNQLERIQNVKGAFSLLDREKVYGKTILLIDDVMTTAATINECARVLLTGGAKKVLSLTVARTKTSGVASF